MMEEILLPYLAVYWLKKNWLKILSLAVVLWIVFELGAEYGRL